MKAFFVRTALFLLLLFMLLSILESLLVRGIRNTYNASNTRTIVNGIMNHLIDPDIAIFGSSVVVTNFNPDVISKITNLTTFNLGANGQILINYRGILKEFNKYSQNCQYVIIGITINEFEPKKYPSGLNAYLPFLNNPEIRTSLLESEPELTWKLQHIPFYSFVGFDNDTYKYLNKGLQTYFESPKTTIPPGIGFSHQYQHRPTPEKNFNNLTEIISIQSNLVAHYLRLIDEIKKQNRIPIIVFCPVYKTRKYQNLKEYENIFYSFEKKGVIILNYFNNFEFSEQKQYYYDVLHLNSEGASIFSERIGNDLAAIIKAKKR